MYTFLCRALPTANHHAVELTTAQANYAIAAPKIKPAHYGSTCIANAVSTAVKQSRQRAVCKNSRRSCAMEPAGTEVHSQAEFVDGLTELENDHKHFFKLFEEYRKANAEAKYVIIERIVHDVSLHASAEERYVYPLILSKLKNDRALFERHLVDHQACKEYLDFLERHKFEQQTTVTELYNRTVEKFIDIITEHINVEEGKCLVELGKVLTKEEIKKLGESLRWAKKHGPGRLTPIPAPRPGVLPEASCCIP